MKHLLSVREAAHYLGISKSWLDKQRTTGGGPRYIRVTHRSVRYDVEDLEAWVASRKANSTSEAPQGGSR